MSEEKFELVITNKSEVKLINTLRTVYDNCNNGTLPDFNIFCEKVFMDTIEEISKDLTDKIKMGTGDGNNADE